MNVRRAPSLLILALGAVLATQPSLADVPVDPAQRFKQVQELRNNGQTDAALVQLDGLIADFPFDVDYALARAYILSQLKRDAEALRELSVATDLAPDYEEVWRLRFKLLDRDPSEPALVKRAALQKEAAKRFPYADWWRTPGAWETARWTLLFGAGHEELSNNLPSWNNQFMELQLKQDSRNRHYLRLGRDARYVEADTSIGAGTERSWESGWFAGLDASIAGSPTYQPELGYSTHAGKTLSDGWVVDLRYRRREYATATVGSVIGTVEKYVGDYRFAYSLGWSRLQGLSSFANHVLTTNWFYSDASSIGVTVNTGNEAESIGNGAVLETDVRGITLSGRRKLNERVAIQWWLGMHNQGDFYRRRFLGMALSIRI